MNFIERQFQAVIELLFDEDDSHLTNFQKWLRIIANFVLLLAIIAILVRLTLLGRNYLFENVLGNNEVAVSTLNTVFRSAVFFVFLATAFLVVIRILLYLRTYIKPFEVVLVLAIVKISSGAFEFYSKSSDFSDVGKYVVKLFVD